MSTESPDINGFMFSKEAINKICNQELNIPIVDRRNEREVVIGVCSGKPTYLNGYLFIDGMQYGNGLEFICKDIGLNEDGVKVINSFEIVGYSLDTVG
jgi:hypothetical protein